MRTTWLCLALLTLHSPACGPDGGRDESETLTTQPATTTDPGATTSTSTGSDSSAAPTSSGSATSETATGGTTMSVSTSSSGDATSPGTSSSGDGSSSDGSETGVVKLDLPVLEDMPIPVHDIPGLESITFYETTGMVTEYTFLVAGPELNNLLADPLSLDNRDIQGTSVEFYDVFYSDEDGTFNADGSYLTIAGSFGAKLPAGGGLNLAEISLNYADDSVEYGSFLASFLGLGDNYAPGSEPNAIDGNLATHTTMGNNVDEPGKRLRVTLGFKSSLMPG
jgi:hypothetical protein